jgi:AcrR family transcriptional regulator
MSNPDTLRVPTQERSKRTRAALVRAARAEFARKGYALTTAKSIADRAHVGVGTFYHYFPDKDVVLREITGERVQWMRERTAALLGPVPATEDLAALATEGRRRLRSLVELFVDYHRTDKSLHTVITERRLCDPELDTLMVAGEREAVRSLREVMQQFGHDGDVEAAAFIAFSTLEGSVHGHVLGQPLVSDERFVSALVEALLRIGAPAGFFHVPT